MVEIEGYVAPGLEPVRDAFAGNFARTGDYQEIGASLCVYRKGERILDLWGGHADKARTRAWSADTLVNVWSTTKLAAAVCVALLVDRGLIAYGQPVAEVWPAFAQAGKGEITIAQVMSHQAGLPGFAEPTTLDDLYDWDLVCDRLAAQAPVFAPGSANSYHAATYGFLAGEIVRRAGGKTLGVLFATRSRDRWPPISTSAYPPRRSLAWLSSWRRRPLSISEAGRWRRLPSWR
jgi:CubicO group peptidase (beta-lactamase class C family)